MKQRFAEEQIIKILKEMPGVNARRILSVSKHHRADFLSLAEQVRLYGSK